ncbi:MAG: hypothetical protein IPM54_08655 [Polyangiaceae bacterium]|nr:hypothetical protein [Polyangiaceae bacterium]
MPNGHVHYDACDILHWRFTEQGYPPLVVDRFDYSRGLRLLQLRGIRGYAPMPKMDTWKYWPPPPRKAERADYEQFASMCIDATRALLVSNPNDALDPKLRHAQLAWLTFDLGWAIVVGFNLYVREGTEPLRLVNEFAVEYPDDLPEEHRAMLAKVLVNQLSAICTDGLTHPFASLAKCVVDFRNCSEILLTSIPLHGTAVWSEVAGLPVFDARAAGLLVGALREHGLGCEMDQLAVRWSKPST